MDRVLAQPHESDGVLLFGTGCHQVDVLRLPRLRMMGIDLRPRAAQGIQQSSTRAMP
jgi:hypothetical protein